MEGYMKLLYRNFCFYPENRIAGLIELNMGFCSIGDYINILKTTFDSNFDLYKAFKQYKNMETKRSCQLKSFSSFTCKLVIREKLVGN